MQSAHSFLVRIAGASTRGAMTLTLLLFAVSCGGTGGSAQDSDAGSPAADAGRPDSTATSPPDGGTDGGTHHGADGGADAALDGAADAWPEGAPDAKPDGPPAPADAPASLTQSTDSDFLCGQLTATVTIGKAVDETDITSYALYWGTDASTKLSPTPIAVVPKTGSDITYQLQQASFPAAATYLLAYSVNQAGDSAAAASTAIVDLGASAADISSGQPAVLPSTVIDAANGKLLVVAENAGPSTSSNPALFRCNIDGSGCTYTDISAGQSGSLGWFPSALIDGANSRLLAVSQYGFSTENFVGLSRCNLDGSGCVYADITAGQPANNAWDPAAVIDAEDSALLVAATDATTGGKPVLFHCQLDGSGCIDTDISAGQPASSGYVPSVVIDTANKKLLVVTEDRATDDGGATNDGQPALFRCNLDGSGCAYVDLSAGQPPSSGLYPFAVIDPVNGKLLVVTEDEANGSKPALFRCNLDGSGCTYTDISAGQPANSGHTPAAVVDAARGQLLVVTVNAASNANEDQPVGLFRCNLDGTGCTYIDFSAGETFYDHGVRSSALLDPASGRLLVVNENLQGHPTLLTSCGAL